MVEHLLRKNFLVVERLRISGRSTFAERSKIGYSLKRKTVCPCKSLQHPVLLT
jgi:hypothetical protein